MAPADGVFDADAAKSEVQLFANPSDPCSWCLQVRSPDQTGLLLKVCEVLMGYSVDVCSAELKTSGGVVDSRFELRVSSARDTAESTEWCRELEDFLVKNKEAGGTILRGLLGEESLAAVSRRLRVNPDLLSVVSFREVGREETETAIHYELEIEGLNQAGLLTYTALVLCKCGFSVLGASVSTLEGRVSDSFHLLAESPSAEHTLRSLLDVPPSRQMSRATGAPLPFHATGSDASELRTLMSAWIGRGEGSLSRQEEQDLAKQSMILSPPAKNHNLRANFLSPTFSRDSRAYSGSSDDDDLPSRSRLVSLETNSSATDAGIFSRTSTLDVEDSAGQKSSIPKRRLSTHWTSVTFGNADRYEGNCAIIDGIDKRHGMGCYTYSPCSHDAYKQYTGQWKEDRKHGHGVLFLRSGGVYVGQWMDNRKHGLGVLLDCPGMSDTTAMPSRRYEGQWAEDLQHGLGVEETEASVYFGSFTKGKRGRGVCLTNSARVIGTAALRRIVDSEESPLEIADVIEAEISRLDTHDSSTLDAETSKFGSSCEDLSARAGGSRPSVSAEAGGGSIQFALFEENDLLTSPPKGLQADLSDAALKQQPIQHAEIKEVATGSSRACSSTCSASTVLSKEATRAPNPLLWQSAELAAFMSCLGISREACQRLRRMKLEGGASQLLEKSNSWFHRELGLWSPVERLVVRQAFRRLLDTERFLQRRGPDSGSRRPSKGRQNVLSDDSVLGQHVLPLDSLSLQSKISQGGFGTVYRGLLRQEKHSDCPREESSSGGFFRMPCFKSSSSDVRPVAVKEMKGEQRISMHELLKEACVMASLRHDNIAAFIGVCADKTSSKYYIVSELAECSLFDMIHQPHKLRWNGELTALIALELARGICAGIAHLHSCSLVHADLKSSNVLVNFSSGVLKPLLCDFGHAAVRSVPSPHHRCGTPHWAAPEVLRGEGLGPAADIYSLGVMLWEMLTQRLPHRGLSFCQVLGAVGWAGWVPDMTMLPEGSPGALLRFLQSSLAFAPAWRPRARQAQRSLREVPRRERLKAFMALEGFFQ
eukprot:TRINITY_DN62508_c0_g1_i1.p1 TRINITY_DN62508_c0_g1~~TRINITY_DN62508_c0_g1_i1.p1  ORF type:complete len:1048 (+),score=154.81 TRINITY_DN62508_c0_g1_i1:20-3163(+)